MAGESVPNMADDLRQKGAGATGRVEELDLVEGALDEFVPAAAGGIAFDRHRFDHRGVVGKARGQPKTGFENLVNGAHDKPDDGLGRVIDPAAFAQGRIIGGEEGFIEVHEGVFLRGGLAEIGQDVLEVHGAEDFHEVIHHPRDAVVEVHRGNRTKQIAEEGIGLGHEGGSFLAGKVVGGGVVEAGCEHAVGDGLGVNIREGFRVEIMQQNLLEGGQLLLQRVVWRGVLGEHLPKNIPHQPGFLGQSFGQHRGGTDLYALPLCKVADEPQERLVILGTPHELPPLDFGHPNGLRRLAGAVEPEFQVVGQDQIVEGGKVAAHLGGLFLAPQVLADVLGLDIADDQVAPQQGQIRCAAFNPGGFVDQTQGRENVGKEILEMAPVGMLGGLAQPVQPPDFAQVFPQR
ncbi:MAG: hypothetical protein BWX54_02367 [Verrucomicrobia bacterium ADurb.Bin018]|nr:MAG: hypothetical protein BWX54_02367 [Verrucomicrobia bacterium ADurb.Bin018]